MHHRRFRILLLSASFIVLAALALGAAPLAAQQMERLDLQAPSAGKAADPTAAKKTLPAKKPTAKSDKKTTVGAGSTKTTLAKPTAPAKPTALKATPAKAQTATITKKPVPKTAKKAPVKKPQDAPLTGQS